MGYLLGRRFGRNAFMAPGPFMNHRVNAIRYGDGFFERHGPKAVFIGRWIALVRFATAWLAGINRMQFKQFFFWNALGGLTWGITYGLVGYFGGQAAAHVLAQAGIAGLVVMVLMGVGAWLLLRRRERRMTRRSD
jgi:membrane protein DedA with SNARE-associated domain